MDDLILVVATEAVQTQYSAGTKKRAPPFQTNDLRVIRANYKTFVVTPIQFDSLGHNNNISNRINIDELNEFFERLKVVESYDLTKLREKRDKIDGIICFLCCIMLVATIVASCVNFKYAWVFGVLLFLHCLLWCVIIFIQGGRDKKMFVIRKKLIDEKINDFNLSTLSQKQLTLEMDYSHEWYIIKYTGPPDPMPKHLIEGQ